MNPLLLPAASRQPRAASRDFAAPWTRTLHAFLDEKERRFGSKRTMDSYARLLWPFFEGAGSHDSFGPSSPTPGA